jgi:hypothetical protein
MIVPTAGCQRDLIPKPAGMHVALALHSDTCVGARLRGHDGHE